QNDHPVVSREPAVVAIHQKRRLSQVLRNPVCRPVTRMLDIQPARESDVPVLMQLIRGLAEFEKLPLSATEEGLRETLFGPRPYAEVLIARLNDQPVGYALFFHTYSTFLTCPGLYLEDLYVVEAHRSKGIGRALLARVAKLAMERKCARLDWAVLAW